MTGLKLKFFIPGVDSPFLEDFLYNADKLFFSHLRINCRNE